MNEKTARLLALGGYLLIGVAYIGLFYVNYQKQNNKPTA